MCLGVGVLIVTTGCTDQSSNEVPNVSQTEETSGESLQATMSDADQLWKKITSSGMEIIYQSNRSDLENFLVHVDDENLRRRELGIQFWRQFPSDQRRYLWLIKTVHMPPSYAVDREEWLASEVRVEPSAYVRDEAEIQRWQDLYQYLKGQFLQSSSVTDQQKRFLLFGEIEQEIRLLIRQKSQLSASELPKISQKIRSLFDDYAQPVSVQDENEFRWIIKTLLNDSTQLHSRSQDVDRIRAFLGDCIRRRDSIIGEACESQLNEIDRGENQIDDSNLKQSENVRVWTALASYESDQSSTIEGRVVFFHDLFITLRKYRELGIQLWRSHPEPAQQAAWIRNVNWNTAIYPKNFVDAIYAFAEGNRYDYIDDESPRVRWMEQYRELREEYVRRFDSMDDELTRLAYYETWGQLWEAKRKWIQEEDNSAPLNLLDNIRKSFNAYGNESGIANLVGLILRDQRDFGLSDSDITNFLAHFANSENTELTQIVESFENRLELKNIPFEFEGLSLDGSLNKVEDYRGKIVLVDHWATSCVSCISAMPRLRDSYLRYRDRGFEVFSIAYDATSNRARVRRIKDELELVWMTVDGEGQWERISARYGYQGFPQYMLLNRDGTLYAGTGEVDIRNLEALLEEMLAGEAAEKEAATVH